MGRPRPPRPSYPAGPEPGPAIDGAAPSMMAMSRSARVRSVMTALVAVVLALAAVTPAGAESPTEVAEELATDGVFVAPGREIDEAGLAVAVEEARARGLRLVVVVPNDPQPTVTAFARRVQEASDADVAIVFPIEGGVEAFAIEEFESAHIRSLTAARAKSSPVEAVETYTEQLLTEPTTSLPPIVGQLITIVVLLALVLAGAVAVEQLLRRMLSRGNRTKRPSSPGRGAMQRDLLGRAGRLVDR